MYTNITDEQLKELLTNIIIPGSSIGVHGIGHSDNVIDVYNQIVETGLNITTPSYGVVGNVTFINPEENPDSYDIHDITSYTYGDIINNKKYTVIIAIPNIMELPYGPKYFVGNFYKFSGYGKDDDRARSLPINKNISKVPSEFIVGAHIKEFNDKYYIINESFLLNNNYIGLKNSDEQQLFYEKFLDNNEELYYNLLTLDEDGIEAATVQTKWRLDKNNYYQYFLNYVESENKGKHL